MKPTLKVGLIESADTQTNRESPFPPVASAREEVEREMADVFVRAARLLGFPRSLGEIFGLLYVSREPLSMDDIRKRLNISLGSASQGLRQLRAFRAVNILYVPGERKDYFVAEPSVRRLVSGFIQEEIRPHLESGKKRLETMHVLLREVPEEEQAFLRKKVEQLEKLHKTGDKLLSMLVSLIKI